MRVRFNPGLAAGAALVVAAAAYGTLPMAYTYFNDSLYFQGFPGRAGEVLGRSLPTVAFMRSWGWEPTGAFVDHDVTCKLEPLPEAGQPCARALPSNGLFYGPYERLPKGRYEATFVIDAPQGCGSRIHTDILALKVRRKPLQTADFLAGGRTEARLRFEVGDQSALYAPFEYRVAQHGPACATLKAVRIRRLPPTRSAS